MSEDHDSDAFDRAVRRRRRRQRARLVAGRGVAVVALAATVVVGLGLNGTGPLAGLRRWTRPVDDTLRTGAGDDASMELDRAMSAGTTTSTQPVVERRTYSPGDCVRFGAEDADVDVVPADVVPCEKPHTMEVAGRYRVTDRTGDYPEAAYWDAIFDTGPCLAMAEQYVHAKLDPDGNYRPYGLMPTARGWRQGDRDVWCGLAEIPYDASRASQEFPDDWTGRVDLARQYRIFPVGSCLGEVGGAWGVVPCDAAHRVEVAGHLDLSKRVTHLPSENGWNKVVGADCSRLARAYAGAALRDPVRAGWLPIEAGSWDAGRRTVLCTIAEYRNGEAATVTRKLGP